MKKTTQGFKAIAIILALLVSAICSQAQKGFLHADGTKIVDGKGENFLIKGMGIGGWMVKEPYMFKIYQKADEGQHKIHNDIIEIIGQENFDKFNEAWLANFFREADVAALKEAGFNTIRIPMHYNLFTLPIEEEPEKGKDTWLEKGFNMIDTLLSWCVKHEIYLILDLHAGPGGQGRNGNINDYDPSKPSLWESDENKRKYIALWGKLAKKYANEPWIGAYDPMNEPNWGFEDIEGNEKGCTETQNIPLRDMYEELITEIRKYDNNHMIAIEGNCWGNNHAGLWPLPVEDNNVCLSFHKYWNPNEYSVIKGFVDLSKEHNVPLWMSESGENKNDWYRDAVDLLEENNIGWCWWTWKKMEHTSSSYSIKEPEGWKEITNYWDPEIEAPKPDTTFAFNVLMQLTENLLLENCKRNDGAIDALLGTRVKSMTK